tara:strand:- start:334 stop:927 length:594 start_codon:yes stop_codon:yes gene_type:complete
LLVYLKRFNMCGKCSNKSCSGCNADSYSPNSSSSLKYDGPKVECGNELEVQPGDSLNEVLNQLMENICVAGGIGGNFYIQLPLLEEGAWVRINIPPSVPINEYAKGVLIDRNACTEDVVVSWINLPSEFVQIPLDPITYPGVSSTIQAPWSRGVAPILTSATGIPAGTYRENNGELMYLRFTSASCGIINLKVEISA